MKAWTIQSTNAFAALNRDGVLFCDTSRTALYLDGEDSTAFVSACKWMMDQMVARMAVRRPEKAAFPLWAWVQVGSYKKEYHPSGNQYEHGKSVLLTLDVPDDEILLSDFDIWNCVLNGFSTGAEKELSWERVFDLDKRDKDFPTMKRNRKIQGTLWQIRSEWENSQSCLLDTCQESKSEAMWTSWLRPVFWSSPVKKHRDITA